MYNYIELPLKCGHHTNQDTFGCRKSVRNREVPLYNVIVFCPCGGILLTMCIHYQNMKERERERESLSLRSTVLGLM